MTALHQAAFNGNVPMMQVLLEPRGLGGTCGTPEASRRCTWPATRATAKRFTLLAQQGSQPDLPACGGLSPATPRLPGRPLRDCEDAGCCSNSDGPMLRTEDGRTPPLMSPANRLLLASRGEPERMTEHGTCLHLAAIHASWRLSNFCLEGE
uniref:ANK_REP_REGION domain-containing protein n=1 Tax=Macrostomum lignano TaxID=282301 RepID=A0A1I8FQT9_9PLAT